MSGDTAGCNSTASGRELEPLGIAAALQRGGAAAVARGGLSDVEHSLFADAADGQLEQHSLLIATLVASGVELPDVLDHYQRQLDGYAAELKKAGTLNGSGRENVEAIFSFLHRRILHRGYRIECTDLRMALDDGRYNCVSASVLFQCLAERCGLDVRGLEMPGHAMSRVYLAEEVLEVETTCAAWFRLMDDPKRQAQSVRETLGTTPGRSDAAAREISSVGLVAMVYYNRGVDLLAEGRYADAALANAKALVLDPGNQTARGNLLATVNNWAIALGRSGRWDEAVVLLEAGLTFAPEYEPFALNLAHVQYQRHKHRAEDDRHGEQPVDVSRRAAAMQAQP